MIAKVLGDGLSLLNTLLDHVFRAACDGQPCCPMCGEEMVITNVDITDGRWDEVYVCPTCDIHATISRHAPWDLFS